ncbi:F0F1 ATP synthase subunit A [Fastidiosipila sanguinis]|uniref:ATP synthase subunit a n=1 Tax=Fastidiosipila sanguinis TaxID=236753 RepID=A0A2S0KN71_9FIRM|nr:FoF1 ATP synthase subunit a [Fastidiosipila sanguinis]AVM42482.1 hypothetical protein C5Q98_04280 [Fastidiosipila sanguinis]
MDFTNLILTINIPGYITTMVVISIILIIVAWLIGRKITVYGIGKAQAVAEMGTEMLMNLVEDIMGSRKKMLKYTPYLASMFLFIIVANYSGMVPGAGTFSQFTAPTSTLTVTLSLGISALIMTITFAIKAKGTKAFLRSFIEPYAIVLPLNIIDEVTKPVSLGLRLFGSIIAEEILIAAVYNIMPWIAPIPFYFISVFFGALQAFIFTVLTSIYISGATSEE